MAKELGSSQGSVRNIVTKKLRLRSIKINCVRFLNETMKAKQQEKSRWCLYVKSALHGWVYFHRWAASQSLKPQPTAQEGPVENCGCKNHRSQSFAIIGDGVGRDLRHREDAADLHRSKRQNQCRQLSTTGPPQRIEAVPLPRTLIIFSGYWTHITSWLVVTMQIDYLLRHH